MGWGIVVCQHAHRALLGLASLVLLSACGGSPTVTPPPTTPGAVSASTAARATLTPTIPFPQFAPIAGTRTVLTAGLRGTLTLDDNCLRVVEANGPSYLIVWPAEVALRTDGGDIRIVDSGGRLVARLGGAVALAGSPGASLGRLGSDPYEPLRETPPARCPGPYWVAGALIPPQATPGR